MLIRDEQAATLSTSNEQAVVTYTIHATQTPITGEEVSPAITAESQIGVLTTRAAEEAPQTRTTTHDDRSAGFVENEAKPFAIQGFGDYKASEVASSMRARDYRDHTDLIVATGAVRRLTPLECTRLQGFPDGWVDIGDWTDTKGKLHLEVDAPKYKALGNSIALPFWEWMAERMVAVLKRDGVEHPTMCSLFDGIGGFPLSFQRAGCEPVWASEIEEFPIAVTKKHFPEPQVEQEDDR